MARWSILRLAFGTLFLSSSLSISSCKSASPTSSPEPKDSTSVMGPAQPQYPAQPRVTIELRGKPGETSETRYLSNSHSMAYQDGQLLRERTESVDFAIGTHVSAFEAKDQSTRFESRTLRKDGAVSLHEFAFPEMGEQIDYIVRSNGQVLKAGAYAKESLFFVPSVPIPAGPVAVGESWKMEHSWRSDKSGIPLTLAVVATLKNIRRCEGHNTCADIEIAGHVEAPPAMKGSSFASRVWGRMLFSLERGDVIWSEMRSHEEMSFGTDKSSEKMVVSSCMVSETKLSTPYKKEFSCEPGESAIAKVPNF